MDPEGHRRLVAMDVAERVAALERIGLFDGLLRDDLVAIAARSHVLSFSDGEVIVPEGEEGLGFYVILAGRARVERDGREVARLGPGDFFGEIALLESEPRSATVVASGELRCLGILRSFFRALLADQPRLAMRIVEEEGRRRPADTGEDG